MKDVYDVWFTGKFSKICVSFFRVATLSEMTAKSVKWHPEQIEHILLQLDT